MYVVTQLINLARTSDRALNFLAPVFLLGTRLWVASVFFKSGLVKIQSFQTTVFLFENEYHVPFLSPTLAAYMGTFTELVFPVLLAIGLAGRANAGILFIFNIIAVLSYPDLMPIGVKDHQLWGFMLAMLVFFGPGKLSLDRLLVKRFSRNMIASARVVASRG
jgi:putative oxidoreductase